MMKRFLTIALLIATSTMTAASIAAVLGSPVAEVPRELGPADSKCHLTACYQVGKYAIGTIESKASMIYFYWKQENFSLSRSRSIALRLAPSDAKLVSSKTGDSGTLIEIYRSLKLSTAFSAKSEAWRGAPAGTFTVMHSPGGAKTIVALGESE